MAKDNIIGLAMELDVADLKTGIKQVNDLIKKSKDQFNLATAGMDKWTKSSEGLNAKLTQLNSQLDLQKKKVSGYKAEIERISKLEGDHSQELENLKSKLQKAQIEVKKTEQAISHYSSELDDVTKEEKKSSSELGKLTKKISEQKNELEDLSNEYKNTVLTYGKNSKEAKNLEKQIKELNNELKNNENQVAQSDKAYDDLSNGIKNTSEKLKNVLIGVGGAIAGIGTAMIANVTKTAEYGDNIDKLSQKMGFSAEGFQEWDFILQHSGTSMEVLKASMKTLSTAVDNNSEAFSRLGISQEELANMNQEEIFEKVISSLQNIENETERTALAGKLLGRGATELGALLNTSAEDISKMKNEVHSLGGVMSDSGVKSSALFQDNIQNLKVSFQGLANNIGAKLLPEFNKLIPKISDLVASISPMISEIIPKIIDKLPKVINLFKIFGPIILGLVGAFKSYEAITKLSTIAQTALNVAMKANPIGLVVTAVGLLVGAFTSLWNNCEGFRNFWIDMWNKIKEFTKNAIDFVKNLITETLPKVFTKVKDIGKNILSGLWEGIKGSFNWLKDKVYSAGESVLGWFKDVFGIHSPSKEMKKQGKYLDEGLAEGIEKNSGDVHEAIEDVSEDLKETVENTELELPAINTELADSSFAEFVNNLKVKLDEVHFDHWIGQVGNVFSTITDSISKINEQQMKEIDYRLKQSNKLKDVEIANAKERTAKEIELLKKQYDEGKISYEDFTKKKETLEKNLSGTIETLNKDKEKAEQEALKQKDRLARQQFNAQKANQIAQAVIDGAKAILLGFAQLGPVAGGINAGIQAGITTAQIAVIRNQKYIPMLAKGGVVDKSTLAMIGESGKEAVMPLENNTGWIKELAMKLNSFMNKDFGFNKFSSGLRTPKIINNYSQTINAPRIPSRIELYRDTKNLLSLKGV